MRKLIYIIILFPILSMGQTDTINHIKTLVYRQETTTTDPGYATTTVLYVDGLGRPVQKIQSKASSDNKDIITHIEYDAYGREAKQYLPFASNNENMLYDTIAKNHTLAFYNTVKYDNTSNPYVEIFYEPSPLGRVSKQGSPGDLWKGIPDVNNLSDHTVKYSYQTNKAGEVRRFRIKYPDPLDVEKPQLSTTGYIAKNQLFKTITKSENWTSADGKANTSEEFKNRKGQIILKRAFIKNSSNQDISHDTYYVYDDFDELIYIIPPMAADQIVVENGFFQISGTFNRPWTKLIKTDQITIDGYASAIEGYDNSEILNLDLLNQFGGQGGFGISTDAKGELVLNINASTISPMEYNTGVIASLDDLGSFDDKEIGRIKGDGYTYTFFIRSNSVVVDGEGLVPSLVQTLYSGEKLDYSNNYPWIDVCEVDSGIASRYKKDIEALDNADILTTYTPNDYNAMGGLSISVANDDNVTMSLHIASDVEISLVNGVAFTIDVQRALPDILLGTASGPNYSYKFEIVNNQLKISGVGKFKTLNFLGSYMPLVNYEIREEAKGLCYIYHYDSYNRIIEKHIPDQGWKYIVYNKGHLPVLTQDENLRKVQDGNNWLFTKFDKRGRIAYTGEYRDNRSRSEIQQGINASTYSYIGEYRSQTPFYCDGLPVYYQNLEFPSPLSNIYTSPYELKILNVNYYDDYLPFVNENIVPAQSTSLGSDIITNVNGMPSGSKIRVLGTNTWTTSVIGYDKKGRNVWTQSSNPYLGTDDLTEELYTFTGEISRSVRKHSKTGQSDISIYDAYYYDLQGRLKEHIQGFNPLWGWDMGPSQLIAYNKYDELGKLTSKLVGNDRTNPLQTIDYKYNIRGWLKAINDVANLTTDLFAFGIQYYDNGNISQTNWKSQSDIALYRYDYEYDGMNRFINSTFYKDGVPTRYGEGDITYDKNGNIQQLTRSGLLNNNQMGTIDVLAYIYKPFSNQLLKVNDLSGKIEGFNDLNIGASNDYDYDGSGNMVKDLNKSIGTVQGDEIKYNHLNQPIEIIKDVNHRISYTYDSAGNKLDKVVINGSANSETTQYANNFVYLNDKLQYFAHPEGYARLETNGKFTYIYQYKDHLGNIRLSYGDTNGDKTISSGEIIESCDYYPLGMAIKKYNNPVLSTNIAQKIKYNGKELQDELDLNFYDFGGRNYDFVIGRWVNVDPLADKYPNMSPYVYCANNPVIFLDPDGRDFAIQYIDDKGKSQIYNFNGTGANMPNNKFVKDFVTAYNYNVGNGGGKSLKAIAENKYATVSVQQQSLNGNYASDTYSKQEGSFGDKYNVVSWNPNLGMETTNGYFLSPATVLEHEASHALGALMNIQEDTNYGSDPQYDSQEERRVITGPEQETAQANGEIPMFSVTRTDHQGLPVVTNSVTSNKPDKQKTYEFHKKRKYKNESFTPSFLNYAP